MRKPLRILLLATFIMALTALPVCGYALTVGAIVPENDPHAKKAHAAFIKRLEERGVKGKVNYITQSPKPDRIALKNSARKLVAHNVDFIVTYGGPATLAALGEQPPMPIIYGEVYKPLVDGIDSKRAAGVCINPPVTSLLRYMSVSAKLKRIGILHCGHEAGSSYQARTIAKLARKAGVDTVLIDLKNPADVTASLSSPDVGFFFITTSSCLHDCSLQIGRISENRRIPLATVTYIEGLNPVIAYYSDPEETGMMMADIFNDLVWGGKTSDIARACTSKSDLIFNIGKARSLGLSIPMELVTGASKVIY